VDTGSILKQRGYQQFSLLLPPPLRPPLPRSRRNLGLGCSGHPAPPSDDHTHRHRLGDAQEPGELRFEFFDPAFDLGSSVELFDGQVAEGFKETWTCG